MPGMPNPNPGSLEIIQLSVIPHPHGVFHHLFIRILCHFSFLFAFAFLTRAKRSQIIKRIYPRVMPVVPFYPQRVMAHRVDSSNRETTGMNPHSTGGILRTHSTGTVLS